MTPGSSVLKHERRTRVDIAEGGVTRRPTGIMLDESHAPRLERCSYCCGDLDGDGGLADVCRYCGSPATGYGRQRILSPTAVDSLST
jgi:hypothetical protein